MGTGDSNQNSILKGILQNGSSFNYPGKHPSDQELGQSLAN